MDSNMIHPGSPGLSSHIMESLFFSMSVYEPTREAVVQDLQRRFGKVHPLIDYGFDEDGKQAIFVAKSQTGRIVVACRGTAGLSDVLQDLKYLQSRLSFVKGAAHWGFAERAESVPIDFLASLLEDGEEVIFTGHSLGGAVASLLCLRLLESSKGMFHEQVHCITFGCPLFASCRLAELINSNYKDVFIHIVSRRDVVPKILPFLSTLQKLVYADEDHLEGLFVLKNALAFLPWLPLASAITVLERKIPSFLKVLFRCFMKLAFPSGMTGSYAFAGHIVMLDTEAAVDKSLKLSSADEMNAWYSQLGFAFGSGFDVAMIEEHMLECYHDRIVRAFAQIRVIRGLTNSRTSLKAASNHTHDLSVVMMDKVLHQKENFELNSYRALATGVSSQQQSFFVQLHRQESIKEVQTLASRIEVRCGSIKATSSIVVKQSGLLESQEDGHCHVTKKPASSAPAWTVKSVAGIGSAVLARTRSAGEHNSCVGSTSSRLQRSMTMTSSNSIWVSRSKRDSVFVRRKDRSTKCRTCLHLQLHMNVKACCDKGTKKGFTVGWFLGTIGRVARHLRVLDNLCYLTFIRIIVGTLIG